MATASGATAAPVAPRRGRWSRLPVVKHLRQSVGLQRGMLVAGLVLTGLFVLAALFAPLIAPFGFGQVRDAAGNFGAQDPPSGSHWLGTTVGGFDVWSRVLWGARTTLLVIVVAVVVSLVVGVLLGLLSGYFGGWLDRVLVVICDAIYAFPSLLLAIVIAIAISGGQSSLIGGILAAAIAVTVVYVPQYFRVVRAEVVRIKAEPYVESARVIGAGHRRIMGRHVLRNSTRTLPLIVTLNASEAILTLAALGYLGFGIQPTSGGDWGFDLNKSIGDVTAGIWWTAVFPGLAIVLTVLGLTLVGEGLNDLADPRLRTRRRVVDDVPVDATAPALVTGGSLGPATVGVEGSLP